MKNFENNFIVFVLVANLIAVVFYGGRYILTGSIESPKHAEVILVKSDEDNAANKATTQIAEASAPAAPIIADASKGKKVSGKCKACHGFDAGGKHKVGPNLFAIFNKPIAEQAGYSYSSAFKAKKGEVVWDEAALDAFLTKPKKFAKGTKMAFPGIRKEQDRANLIAWLQEQK